MTIAGIFSKILEMSIQAGILIIVIMALRPLIRRLPKNVMCILWAMTALRLAVPVNIESRWSLVPDAGAWMEETAQIGGNHTTVTTQESLWKAGLQNVDIQNIDIQNTDAQNMGKQSSGVQNPGAQIVGNVNSISDQGSEKDYLTGGGQVQGLDHNGREADSMHGGENRMDQGTLYSGQENATQNHVLLSGAGTAGLLERAAVILWIMGMTGFLLYGTVSYLRIRLHVREAVLYRDNIRQCSGIDSPFVLGYLKPQIYIPFHMEEQHLNDVIRHEQAHIARKDYLSKPAGFLLASVYWFHPLVWAAYILFCRDVEMACDERAIRNLSVQEKKHYSETLLFCSINKRQFLSAQLAFGERNIRKRISNVLHYKKPGFRAITAAAVICLTVAVCFLTSSEREQQEPSRRENGFIADTDKDLEPVNYNGPEDSGNVSSPQAVESLPVEGSGFEEVVAGLSDDMFYSLVDTGGDIGRVLLVTDMIYRDISDDIKRSFSAEAYYVTDGNVHNLGYFSGSGTAYPIKYDRTGLYAAGGHYVGRYRPAADGIHIELVEYANEVFDEEGNVTYTVLREGMTDEIVEDDSFLEELRKRYGDAKEVQFVSAAGELVPDVVIDPAAAVTALPMETVAEADLDGDGIMEFVQVRALKNGVVERPEESGWCAIPSIQIGDNVFSPQYIFNLGIYEENLDIATYYIFDLDLNDSYKEIGIFFDGPSADPVTYLMRYQQGKLVKLGSFESQPIRDTYPESLWGWGDEDYQEVLDSIDRNNILIKVPGDGTITASGRLDIIETNWGDCQWKLDEESTASTGKLVRQIPEMYTIYQWVNRGELALTTAGELKLFKDKLSMDSLTGDAVVTIPEGEKVSFYRYYPEEGWVQMAYGDVSVMENDEDRKTAEEAGTLKYCWFRWNASDWTILTAAGELDQNEAFRNLSYVD